MEEKDELEKLEDQILNTPLQLVNYSFQVNDDLYNRFNKHLHLLKRLENSSITKQRWITEAINEKLASEKSNPESIAKNRHISFRVEKQLSKSIEASIEKTRKFRRSFSKNKWFVEAIYKKLENEELKAKDLLKQMAKSLEAKQTK